MLPSNLIRYVFLITILSPLCSQGQNFNKILEEARQEKDNKKLADTYIKYALHEEQKKRDLSKAFNYMTRGMEYAELLRDTQQINICKFNLARYFIENEMYEDAIKDLNEVKTYFAAHNNQEMVARTELILFQAYKETLDVDLAKSSLDRANSIEVINDDPVLRTDFLINRIEYLQLVREIDSSLILANKCLRDNVSYPRLNQKYSCMVCRADSYLAKGIYNLAISDYQNALTYFEGVPYSKDRLRIYDNLSNCFHSMKDDAEAYLYKDRYQRLKDSIFNENRIVALSNLAYKHQSEEKTLEISILELEKSNAEESHKQQKRALFVLGSLLALLVIGIYYIIRFYKEKIKTALIIDEQNQKINEQRINELQDKIQINSMQSMLSGQEIERERISKDLHDSLGGLLSTIKLQVDKIRSKGVTEELKSDFQSATKLIDTAVSEVRSISQNLQPAALNRLGLVPAINDLINRYQSDDGPEIIFQHFDMPKTLDQMVSLGIFRIIQEILNNAIKHAQANEILVQLNGEDKDIIILVEDDGIGFDTSKKYESMGLRNIESRVNYLKGSIDIDSRINEGTTYLIHVNRDRE